MKYRIQIEAIEREFEIPDEDLKWLDESERKDYITEGAEEQIGEMLQWSWKELK